MKISSVAIGCDHGGFIYKDLIIAQLQAQEIDVHDVGTKSDDSVDYPDFVHPVADLVEQKEVDLGIILCGSGNGAAMTANKHKDIRAALCWTKELAELAKQHNNANILSIPARFVSKEVVMDMVQAFIDTDFEGGRHERRVNKIPLSC